jgi:Protein of unknown function (DUF3309)
LTIWHQLDAREGDLRRLQLSFTLVRYEGQTSERRRQAVLGTILVILLILLLIGALPRWGYSSGWGYGPSGLLGLILIIIVILAVLGRI